MSTNMVWHDTTMNPMARNGIIAFLLVEAIGRILTRVAIFISCCFTT